MMPHQHDSTLLTPLHNSHKHKLNKSLKTTLADTNSLITIENISPPTLVPFDSFTYFSKIKKSNEKSVCVNPGSSGSSSESSSSQTKSASTSYLLSKISSLASLTMPKNRPSANSNISTSVSSSSASSAQQSPILTSSGSGGLINNLASKTTKFFNPKLNQQQIEVNTTPLRSSSSYLLLSSSSAYSVQSFHSNLDSFSSESVNKVKSLKCLSSSSSSTTSSSNSNSSQPKLVTSSRRPFKKRSQSIQASLDKKLWLYDQTEDYWYTNTTQSSSASALTQSSTMLNQQATIAIKRKQLSSSSCSSSIELADQTKLKLDTILVKYLTLIELKYLKQICFNKLQKQLEVVQHELKLSNAYLNSHSTSNQTRLSIPKDESMKTVKTKNLGLSTTRRRSVDFKFFEEIKENYFSKKSQKDAHELVFGQTLYKCILNDLEQSKSNKIMSFLSSQSNPKSNITSTGYSSSTITKKWKSSNNSNLLIASKFDLNILNGISNDPTVGTKDQFYSKRNSVLFEALDLKNVQNNKSKICSQNEPSKTNNLLQIRKKNLAKSSSIDTTLTETPPRHQGNIQLLTNNQNLSIRSEGLVPNIVKSCCKHISEHGLDVIGIFRIDSSKKRIKELKEMFDSGKEVTFNESFNANDAACILKEYLRSLPEPLLTRDLYSSFLATNKISDSERRLESIRHLICLLPVPNRDTLEVILKLLDKVRSYSIPVVEDSKTLGGNKMDAFNLAMVFGPNLLKKHKLTQISLNSKLNDFANDKYNLIDDIDSVISVTKYLIEHQNLIFTIDSSLHNELIQTINNVSPSEVNAILSRKIVSSIGITILENDIKHENSEEIPKVVISLNKSKIKQAESVDFIDNGSNKIRTSRTKLHKITNNLTYNNETINLINSPSHSPIRHAIKPPKHRVSAPYNLTENRNNGVSDIQGARASQNQGSSLLLMIQSQGSRPKLKHVHSIGNDNASEIMSMSMAKSARSLSTFNSLNDFNLMARRNQAEIGNNSAYENKLQLCSKYYDKSKFNAIGEQETLV